LIVEHDVVPDIFKTTHKPGNKCFKQNITLQKIEYTDNKLRWKITKMKNIETPIECHEN